MSENNDPTPDPNTERELARARADIKVLRSDLRDARSTADEYRTRLEQQQTQHAEAVSALERSVAEANAQRDKAQADAGVALTEAQTAAETALIAAKAEALATKFGAHNPEDVVRLVDLSGVTRGEDGSFTGLQEAIDQAKEQRAYLFAGEVKTDGQKGSTTTPTPKQSTEPATSTSVKDMSEVEYLAQRRADLGF